MGCKREFEHQEDPGVGRTVTWPARRHFERNRVKNMLASLMVGVVLKYDRDVTPNYALERSV